MSKGTTMLDADAALKKLDELPLKRRVEEVPLAEALGRVLAGPLAARVDSPPFSKAAMDGFAVAGDDDSAARYRIVETIAAGQVPRREIHRGECAKIMTGAMLPEGAGKIIRVEYTEEQEGWMRVKRKEPYENVIYQGENLKAGEPLLETRLIRSQEVGVLASQGYASVPVAVRPRVGVITTGSELRSPGEQLGRGQIYNSNGPQLLAQLAAAGVGLRDYGAVADEPDRLAERLRLALDECDLVLLSGGVSMGELDYVPGVLKELGAEILFHKLAIKPGKPTLFAVNRPAFVFGLPGNPVSTFVIFEVFVRRFLYRWMGLPHRPRVLRASLTETLRRRDAERLEYRPVRLQGAQAHPLAYHGSSHLSALRDADGLIRIERGVSEVKEGSEIDVRLL